MKEMKTLTINGQTYEVVDEAARNAIPTVDSGLNTTGAAADAKAVGDEFASVREEIANIDTSGAGGAGATAKEVIEKLPKTTNVNLTNWNAGGFVETLDDGTEVSYNVTFDTAGKPILIENSAGSMVITWPS